MKMFDFPLWMSSITILWRREILKLEFFYIYQKILNEIQFRNVVDICHHAECWVKKDRWRIVREISIENQPSWQLLHATSRPSLWILCHKPLVFPIEGTFCLHSQWKIPLKAEYVISLTNAEQHTKGNEWNESQKILIDPWRCYLVTYTPSSHQWGWWN